MAAFTPEQLVRHPVYAHFRQRLDFCVNNLLQTGQNINSHGILGVIVGAIVTCSELLTAEKIYQQIIEANKI